MQLNKLESGQVLLPADPTRIEPDPNLSIITELMSPNGKYQLHYQKDGNFVLYEMPLYSGENRTMVTHAESQTRLSEDFASYVAMEDNGQLSIVHESMDEKGTYHSHRQMVWQGKEGDHLFLSDEGDLTLAKSFDDPEAIPISLSNGEREPLFSSTEGW